MQIQGLSETSFLIYLDRNFLYQISVILLGNDRWYIGLADPSEMGNWQYISGGEVTINHWSGGVPSGGEYCVEAFGWNQLWNDVGCGSTRPSICELPAGTYIVIYCLITFN